jgi:uncharacterized integral membrane protein (TIGR00698 family)
MADSGDKRTAAAIDWDRLPHGGDLFGELHLAETTPAPAKRAPLFPGLAMCGVSAAAAAWLSDHYGFPIILLGLLVGLALNFVSQDERTHAGLDFASRTCLRWGIVVLGLQVTFMQIAMVGVAPFAALGVVMGVTLLAGLAGARLAGQSRYAGVLAGGSTAICGASAALALYGVIGKERLSQAQFALTLVGVSLASALAMTVYPVLAAQFNLSDAQAGFLIGASIHDVAQAIGGGFSVSPQAGETATIVKLTRVALLAPMLMLAALWLARQGDGVASKSRVSLKLPWFITAFLGVVVAGSFVTLPQPVRDGAATGAQALLLLAIVATAMKAQLQLLLGQGWRPFAPVAVATLTSFAASLVAALAL